MISNKVEDEWTNINADDKTVLIIENDVVFAKILPDNARDNSFKNIVVTTELAECLQSLVG